MPAKTYPLAVCRKCQKPHQKALDCQTAANLRDGLSIRMSKARGKEEVMAAWRWYDEQFASLGIITNYEATAPDVWEQVTTRKPAKDPRELLSKPAESPLKPATGPEKPAKPAGMGLKTRELAPKTREKPAISRENPRNVQKPADKTREPATETRAKPAETREWKCKRCGNQWPRRMKAKKPPVECPKCRSRKWRGT